MGGPFDGCGNVTRRRKGAGTGSPPACEGDSLMAAKQPTPTVDDDDRDEIVLADLLRLANLTANPLYVWQAILVCVLHETPLPAWCLDYINTTAVLLHDLVDDAQSEHGKNSPAAAIEKVAAALQMVRPGWNAFQRFKADEAKMRDALTVEVAAMAAHIPHLRRLLPNPVETIKRRRILDGGRHIRRRIREGEKLLGRNKGTKPAP
jgi:hypothetical protein